MTDTTTTETDDVSGLKANNADLKSRLDKAQKANRDLEARLAALEEAQSDALDTTKTEAEKAQAKLQRQIDKLTNDLAARDTRLGELLIDNLIKTEMAANNVDPDLAEGVEAILRRDARIVNGEAVTADGTPLADATSAFFASPKAQRYVLAPVNTGAGAIGSTNTSATSKWTAPPTLAQMSEWGRDAVTNPAEYNAMARQWNRPDLEV